MSRIGEVDGLAGGTYPARSPEYRPTRRRTRRPDGPA
jgi:hypothetical protein